jgi:hypothetical protein
LIFTKDYYAVGNHQESQSDGTKSKTTSKYLKNAGLSDEPVRFDMETRIAEILNVRMKMEATDAERRIAGNTSSAFKVQPFQVTDGSLRYYVRAEWQSGKEPKGVPSYVLAAWVAAQSTLRILAVEKRTSPYGGIASGLPDLLNVVDLGDDRTGIMINNYWLGQYGTSFGRVPRWCQYNGHASIAIHRTDE